MEFKIPLANSDEFFSKLVRNHLSDSDDYMEPYRQFYDARDLPITRLKCFQNYKTF